MLKNIKFHKINDTILIFSPSISKSINRSKLFKKSNQISSRRKRKFRVKMIRIASRVAMARSHHLASKSSKYSTCVEMKNFAGDSIQKSKIGNVKGCIPNNPIVAINELKNDEVKNYAEFEFKPASKLMQNCIVNMNT